MLVTHVLWWLRFNNRHSFLTQDEELIPTKEVRNNAISPQKESFQLIYRVCDFCLCILELRISVNLFA